jgi:hypothetical protein
VTCSSARYLLVAGFVGVSASSLSGNDLVGVLAAALAVLGLVAFERLGPRRDSARSCPVPAPARPTEAPAPHSDPTTDRTPADRTTQPG